MYFSTIYNFTRNEWSVNDIFVYTVVCAVMWWDSCIHCMYEYVCEWAWANSTWSSISLSGLESPGPFTCSAKWTQHMYLLLYMKIYIYKNDVETFIKITCAHTQTHTYTYACINTINEHIQTQTHLYLDTI